jgi:hypothetical protein
MFVGLFGLIFGCMSMETVCKYQIKEKLKQILILKLH